MRVKNILAVATLVAGVVAIGPNTARADTVVATFKNVTNNGVLATLNLNDGTKNLTVSGYVGQYNWMQTSANPSTVVLGNAGAFSTFCIEINQDISFGASYGYTLTDLAGAPQPGGTGYWTPAGGMGSAAATEIAQLWAAHIASVATSADNAAAFQFAIWQIIYGSELTITPYQASQLTEINNDIATANSWRLGLSGTGANLIALSSNYTDSPNPNSQDQITDSPYPTPTPTPVPLPATAGAGLALLAGLGLICGTRAQRATRRA